MMTVLTTPSSGLLIDPDGISGESGDRPMRPFSRKATTRNMSSASRMTAAIPSTRVPHEIPT